MLTKYDEYCLRRLLDNASKLVKIVDEKNNQKLFFDLEMFGEEEIRTSIRVNKDVWDQFNEIVEAYPYSQKELLSKALKEFIDKYGNINSNNKRKLQKELEKFALAFKNQEFDLKMISKIVTLIREEKGILKVEQKRVLLNISIDVLENEVSIANAKSFYNEGHYFANNMYSSEVESEKIRKKFLSGNYSLEDITDIVRLVRDRYIDTNMELEFMLRNPEVVLRDDVQINNLQSFLEKGKIYYSYVQQAINNIIAQTNQVLYDIIYKKYELQEIHPQDIEKYCVSEINPNKVNIYRPREMEELHLMLSAGKNNYYKVRELLVQNGIYEELSDDYLDSIYYYLNKKEIAFNKKEKQLAALLNLT